MLSLKSFLQGLKVRSILCEPSQISVSFIDRLIVRPGRPPSNYLVSESNYATQDPIEESALVETFGGFTVESATVSKNTKSVTFYCNKSGIIFGIGVESTLEIQHIGLINGLLGHRFDVNGPNEVIEEIIVETAPGGGGDLIATVVLPLY